MPGIEHDEARVAQLTARGFSAVAAVANRFAIHEAANGGAEPSAT